MMSRVMQATEATMTAPELLSPRTASTRVPIPALSGVHPITAATVHGTLDVAAQLRATMIVITSRSGATARVQAKYRQLTRVVGISDSMETLRQMSLFWGITPLPGAPTEGGPELRQFIESWGKAQNRLATGDRVVYLMGSAVVKSAHNVLVVQEVV